MAQRFLPPAIDPIVIPLSKDGQQRLVCEGWSGPPPLPPMDTLLRADAGSGAFRIESFREAWQYASPLLIDWYGLEDITRMMEAFGWLSLRRNEESYFRRLPDPLVLYRGGDLTERAATAMSWTLGKHWAAARIRKHQPAQVVQGTIRKADVLAFYIPNIEVVVRPGKILIDPTPIRIVRNAPGA